MPPTLIFPKWFEWAMCARGMMCEHGPFCCLRLPAAKQYAEKTLLRGEMRVRGLKPALILEAYAALKRRSSTLQPTVEIAKLNRRSTLQPAVQIEPVVGRVF